MQGEPPLCVCHNEPRVWVKDSQRNHGGKWVCQARRREWWLTYESRRYNTDPIYRIGSNLRRARQKRLKTIERRKANFYSEGR